MSKPTIRRSDLEAQSNLIDHIFASHKVPARVQGGSVSPRWVRYHLSTAPTAKISLVRNLSEELALALGSSSVRIARDGQTLALEVPTTQEAQVFLLDLLAEIARPPAISSCLGLASDGRPLLLRLPSADVAHVLVAGTTGSGKTELLRTMIWSLALTNRQSQLQLVLIDPKRKGLAALESLPHLIAPVLSKPLAIQKMLERLVQEMEKRDAQQISTPHLVVVLDEAADLLLTGGPLLEQQLIRLAQRGRSAGIHLIMGTQNPSAQMFSPLLRANFPVRLVGKVSSATEARIATGLPGSKAELLLGKGDFLAVAAGKITRFQAAYLPAVDWHTAYQQMRP